MSIGQLSSTLLLLASSASATEFVVTAAPRNPPVNNMQALYQPDDPQLVGRLLTVDARFMFDRHVIDCEHPVTTTSTIAVGKLFRAMFPDRRAYQHLYVAKPSSFGLRLASTSLVRATQVRCSTGLNTQPYLLSAVLFTLPNGRKAAWLKEAEDHLLLLRAATGPIHASFDCTRARLPAEVTICSDRALAGWDLTVATLYKDSGAPVDAQRAFLAERDRCGTDRWCLQQIMSARVRDLLH